MYLVELTYTAPLEEIDALLEAHYANPDGAFAQGLVRLAGRLEPRTGGLMILEGDRAAVDRALATDPFVATGAASARVVEFIPTRGATS